MSIIFKTILKEELLCRVTNSKSAKKKTMEPTKEHFFVLHFYLQEKKRLQINDDEKEPSGEARKTQR